MPPWVRPTVAASSPPSPSALTAAACPFACPTPPTYPCLPSSSFLGSSFLASLPAPGGSLEGGGGRDTAKAAHTATTRDPRREAGVLCMSGPDPAPIRPPTQPTTRASRHGSPSGPSRRRGEHDDHREDPRPRSGAEREEQRTKTATATAAAATAPVATGTATAGAATATTTAGAGGHGRRHGHGRHDHGCGRGAQPPPPHRARPASVATSRRRARPPPPRSSVPAREMLYDAKPRNRTRIGADVVCEALLRQGVDVMFGYPGGVILPLYDILDDYPQLRHVLVRHEQGAAHAADGYARASGRVGVCLGTSGPGATNLVTGVGTAQLDSDPDRRHHRQRARRAHRQGRLPGDRHHRHHPADDQAQLPGPQRRRPPARLRRGVPHRPHRPPGPVHVDITKDALTLRDARPAPRHRRPARLQAHLRGSPAPARAGRRGHRAQPQRPVILAGHGVLLSGAVDELRDVRREGADPGRAHAARRRRHRRASTR